MSKSRLLDMGKFLISGVSLFICSSVWADSITFWDPDNVTTDPGPYTIGETYQSTVFTDETKTTSNGAVIWVEGDVMAPGMSVVNDDDVNGSNCVMTAGVNPVDLSVKQCSDPFQTSKRVKVKATKTGTELDLVFATDISGGLLEPYRIFEKYLNDTDFTISDFKIELGFGTGNNFVAAPADLGLDFSDSDGNIWVGEVVTGDTVALNLDALFPFGLFGDADTDPNHDMDGYFDANERARFNLRATRGVIISEGISPNYANSFGDFLAKSQSLPGYFYDHDDDNDTDAYLMAHFIEGIGWITLRPDQWWLDLSLPIPDTDINGSLTEATILNWEANPDDYNIAAIEDLANLNINYHIAIGDTSLWPSYDAMNETAEFTLRISSISVIFANGFE
jgi:hypothetical protein